MTKREKFEMWWLSFWVPYVSVVSATLVASVVEGHGWWYLLFLPVIVFFGFADARRLNQLQVMYRSIP